MLLPVLVSGNLQFIQQEQDSAVLWFPLESLSKIDALLATIPLVTKQKIRIGASNANQESKSQSKLIRVNCREFQVCISVLYADGHCLNGMHCERLLINYQ